MQRVTNCILIDNDHVLLLKKPRRGWFAMPGGKMEQGETIKESVMREFQEETSLHLIDPRLAGVFTFSIFEDEQHVNEWMMFTFISHSFEGTLATFCDEGELTWVPIEQIKHLPMAEGDRRIFEHVLLSSHQDLMYASFSYTENYELIRDRFDSIIK